MGNEAKAALDIPHAHRHFSVHCFNRTWDLIDKPNRTQADDEAMVLCALASLWHWTQRADCSDQNLSIGHWQISRACALAGQGDAALQHGRRSLELAKGLAPFVVGYAHEALARAALVRKDRVEFAEHLREAKSCADAVTGAEDRRPLADDLAALEAAAASAF
jgi:hypothetical protein